MKKIRTIISNLIKSFREYLNPTPEIKNRVFNAHDIIYISPICGSSSNGKCYVSFRVNYSTLTIVIRMLTDKHTKITDNAIKPLINIRELFIHAIGTHTPIDISKKLMSNISIQITTYQ